MNCSCSIVFSILNYILYCIDYLFSSVVLIIILTVLSGGHEFPKTSSFIL